MWTSLTTKMRFSSSHLLLSLLFTPRADASFSLFRWYTAAGVKASWGLSDGCIKALNTTVNCDEATAALAGQGVDYNYWYMQNITTLCTTGCGTSLNSWLSSVQSSCSNDNVRQDIGVVVQAQALALQFTHNYNLVCMQDTAKNWCFFNSQSWSGSDFMRWDPTLCFPPTDASQCTDPNFSVDNIDANMADMTNLYNRTLYCSECYLRLMRQRLLDPWLVSSNHTDYIVAQFSNIQSKCSTSLPYTTSASTLYVSSFVPTATGNATVATTTTTCTGQTVAPIATPFICNDLSDQYNVSTGDARVATNDYFCGFTNSICLPPPCELDVVWDQPTCADLAQRYSNSSMNITEAQFLSWNPNIQGSCDSVAIGQRVCKKAPGGVYTTPASTIYAPTATNGYYTTATPAAPTQSGSIANCGLYYVVQSGDNCFTVAQRYQISFSQLRSWNTYLDSSCSNLWLKYSVCVSPVTPSTQSTDGNCGPGVTCNGTSYGGCCSSAGKCTNNNCTVGGNMATTNGTCGPSVGGLTCTNPSFGPCCSIYGYCGSGKDFCGAGNCYSGQCDPDNGGPSVNGECGPGFAGNKTCTGTQFGNCCSTSGYCGNSTDYCSGKNCYSGACTS